MKEILRWPAAELAQKINRREIKAKEAVSAYLEQLYALEPELNSFVTVDEEGAYAQAGRIDELTQSGRNAGPLAGVPVSIVLGAVLGLAVGFLLAKFFAALHMRDSVKVVILVAFLLVALEDAVEAWVPFSGLLAVLGMGLGLRRWRLPVAERLTAKFGKLWVWAEVMLFVLVGAEVDLNYAAAAGLAAVATVLGVLCFRALGVLLCVAGSKLTKKERLFAVLAYLPKATVQAAIGGVPLAMGLSCGQVVLTVAVIAILVTAPLGALAIDASYKKLLERAAD